MTRSRQAFILVCDVSLFKHEKHTWVEYIEEHESTIVKDTHLEDNLMAQGVDTVKQIQADVVLRQNGYATEC